MAATIAQYTFIPWLRQGLAAHIPDADTLGASNGVPLERASLLVDLTLQSTPIGGAPTANPAISKSIRLLGPGDIRGIRPEAIVRVHPRNATKAFEAAALCYVDFYEEDFPWRNTPARTAAPNEPAERHSKLRPWVALFVLADDEFTEEVPRPNLPPSIKLVADKANAALPRHTETWAWAHGQISKLVANSDAVDGEIHANPDNAIARLISPRRLAADTSYHAFVVPAFETGRLAGLGEDPAAVPAQAPSWLVGAMPHSSVRPLEYPLYYAWSFRTSADGDFETLVRALKPGPVGPKFGKQDVDTSAIGFGMDGVGPGAIALEGALVPPSFARDTFPATPGPAFEDRLEALLDISENLEQGGSISIGHPFHVEAAPEAYGPNVPDDPILTPPVFGKWHAGVDRLADATSNADLAWLLELNLDLRNRAAAGLAIEVIQKRQDEFVERAWQQIGEVERANKLLRHAELAVAASEALFEKHFLRADSDRVVRLTAAAHKRMLAPAAAVTFHATIKESQVPEAAQVGTFKRISRPQQKTIRQLAGSGSIDGLQRNLITNLNLAQNPVTAAPPKPEPGTALEFQAVSAAVAGSIADFQSEGTKPRYFFMEALAADLAARLAANPPANLATLSLNDFKASLHARVNGRTPPVDPAIRIVVGQLIDGITAVAAPDATSVNVLIPPAQFNDAFGADIAGKSYRGVIVVPSGPPRAGEISKMVAEAELGDFQAQLSALNADVLQARPNPPPASPLAGLSPLAAEALTALDPKTAIVDRVAAVLRGIVIPDAGEPRRLAPVMAYPVFNDAMFADLRNRSADLIIPNYADLPVNTITLLKDNERFIEAFMAGLNHEMARELLWREYPTDQRGSYFRIFWDTRDAMVAAGSPDIRAMDQWQGPLGSQSARPGGHLVLVIRGELLRKFPTTLVYAQRAGFDGGDPARPRILADETVPDNIMAPVFRGDLEPDISIFGFTLAESQAKGHRSTGPDDPNPADPGWFFVLKERPGEPSFALDEDGPPHLSNWNDLSWSQLTFPPDSPNAIAIAANQLALDGTGEPGTPTDGTWGKTSADMAYILLQNPVLYARHAEEMLP